MAKNVKKKIAVIGAGPSGLMAVKCCLEEGLDVVCYEMTDTYGGSWNYRYDPVEGVGSIRKSTVSLYSKEMNAFSDFPPPENVPNYMNYENMMDYIDSYAEHYDLLSKVHLEHKVVQVLPSSDHHTTGRWIVRLKYASSMDIREELFDCVISCIGSKGYPNLPTFPGQDTFKGRIVHSKHLRNATDFDNKNVLIVGFGNSAVEAAVEVSPLAKQVYLSTRSGGWVVPRVGKNGLPSDIQFFKRNVQFAKKLHHKKFCKYLEDKVNHVFDHNMYKIRPVHSILAKHPVVNDDLPDKVLTGRVLIKSNINRFVEQGVIFDDEDFVTKVDDVIFATGYSSEIPFLDLSLSSTNLYKFVISTEHPTLAVIGRVRSMGPNIPVCESQCRLVSRVFSNAVKLPPTSSMVMEARKSKQRFSEKFSGSTSDCQMMDYIDYMDELAEAGGFKPNISALFSKDPTLYVACTLGPCLPYQYRLEGPHSWVGAKRALLDYMRRVVFPLSSSKFPQMKTLKEGTAGGWISASVLSLAVCVIINSNFFS